MENIESFSIINKERKRLKFILGRKRSRPADGNAIFKNGIEKLKINNLLDSTNENVKIVNGNLGEREEYDAVQNSNFKENLEYNSHNSKNIFDKILPENNISNNQLAGNEVGIKSETKYQIKQTEQNDNNLFDKLINDTVSTQQTAFQINSNNSLFQNLNIKKDSEKLDNISDFIKNKNNKKIEDKKPLEINENEINERINLEKQVTKENVTPCEFNPDQNNQMNNIIYNILNFNAHNYNTPSLILLTHIEKQLRDIQVQLNFNSFGMPASSLNQISKNIEKLIQNHLSILSNSISAQSDIFYSIRATLNKLNIVNHYFSNMGMQVDNIIKNLKVMIETTTQNTNEMNSLLNTDTYKMMIANIVNYIKNIKISCSKCRSCLTQLLPLLLQIKLLNSTYNFDDMVGVFSQLNNNLNINSNLLTSFLGGLVNKMLNK